MTKDNSAQQQDLSSFAAFDLDDLLAEIGSQEKNKKEVTAYLDRSFIVNSLIEYREEAKYNKQEFTVDNQIDFTDYNFSGADLTGFTRKDLELINFNGCDISFARLDRVSIDYFREYILTGKITYEGIILDNAYLGPTHTRRIDLGIECYMYLNLSNINFTSCSFKNADLEGLILFNSDITGCNFIDGKNLDPKQFAFSIGYEKASFYNDKKMDDEVKAKIKHYSETLNPDEVMVKETTVKSHNIIAYLANLTNILDD